MTAGVAWALVAALGFGFTQTFNRKSNLIVGPFRTAFGLLLAVEGFLVVRMFLTGDHRLLRDAPVSALLFFSASAVIHYVAGWTLLALSQQQVGVARTGAVVSAAPLVGAFLAVPVLGESLGPATFGGVVLTVAGVAMVAISRGRDEETGRWHVPTYGLAVAACWGTSPMFIRKGLEGLDAPVLGLTIGLAVALVVHAAILTGTRSWAWGRGSWTARRWMVIGGVSGSIGIGAQWVSFGLTTIAISITVQQLATLVVVALAPFMFDRAFERVNGLLILGTVSMLSGSVLVVLAG